MSIESQLPGPDVPVIDETRLNAEFGGSPEILAELRDLFLEHSPPLYEGILACLQSGDVQSVVDQAHSLKGACATYGAARLATVCKGMELAARNEGLEEARAWAPHVTQEFEAALAAVEAMKVG